jgi:hypothetical protein
MQQRHLTSAVLASAAFFALSTTAGSQVIVSGNDEKVLWDDVGQAVFSPPGKDTISFIDIGDRENPKILTSIALENSIFGPFEVSPVGVSLTEPVNRDSRGGAEVRLFDCAPGNSG